MIINCPECGHENSNIAVACANCGRPIHTQPPAAERRVVVVPPQENGVPPWAFVAMGVVAIGVIAVLFLVLKSSSDQANANFNANMATARRTTESEPIRTTSVPSSQSQPVSMPPTSSAPVSTTTVPGTATSVPNAPPPDKGSVVINAMVAPRTGSPQAARSTKFYLLDKDLETILSEARVVPIEGNTLSASLGLAAVYPDRYGDFKSAAMRAIGEHVKYSATSGAKGVTNLTGVMPNEYYLFAISRVGNGFALWNSPVSVNAGENVMNLSPQSVTEIPVS